jgi:hypothetical protein
MKTKGFSVLGYVALRKIPQENRDSGTLGAPNCRHLFSGVRPLGYEGKIEGNRNQSEPVTANNHASFYRLWLLSVRLG